MVTSSTRPPIGKPVLDAAKKRLVVGIIHEGGSRRQAARIIGCAGSTITRTARRDPQFGLDILQASEMLELNAVRTLNRVASQDKYWRAAVWVLERLDPERFGLRPPSTLTITEVKQVFHLTMKHLSAVLTEDQRRRAYEKLGEEIKDRAEGAAPLVIEELLANLEAATEDLDAVEAPAAPSDIAPPPTTPPTADAAAAPSETAAPASEAAPSDPPPASDSASQSSRAAASPTVPETAPEPAPAPEKPRQNRLDEEDGEGSVQHTPHSY
jgi:hypothetical protein